MGGQATARLGTSDRAILNLWANPVSSSTTMYVGRPESKDTNAIKFLKIFINKID